MISLLKKLGSGIMGALGAAKGVLGSPEFGDIVGVLGNISSTVGKYQTSKFGTDAMDQVDAINDAYKGQLMARQVGNMVGGATESYGNGLLSSVRAGGTMATYTSSLWQGVREGMEDYGADLRAMALNAKLRQASFASQNSANRMTMLSSMVNDVLNTYRDTSSRVPKGRKGAN